MSSSISSPHLNFHKIFSILKNPYNFIKDFSSMPSLSLAWTLIAQLFLKSFKSFITLFKIFFLSYLYFIDFSALFSYLFIWKYASALLLFRGTRAYLFLPGEVSWYVFSTRNKSWEFLLCDGVDFHQTLLMKYFLKHQFVVLLNALLQ